MFYVYRFKDEEDQIIMKVESCKVIKNKYAVLNLILNRSRKQLYRRLRSLKMKPACESSKLRLDVYLVSCKLIINICRTRSMGFFYDTRVIYIYFTRNQD